MPTETKAPEAGLETDLLITQMMGIRIVDWDDLESWLESDEEVAVSVRHGSLVRLELWDHSTADRVQGGGRGPVQGG